MSCGSELSEWTAVAGSTDNKRKRSEELEAGELDEKLQRTSVEVPKGPRAGVGPFGGFGDQGGRGRGSSGRGDRRRSDRGRDIHAPRGTSHSGSIGQTTNPQGRDTNQSPAVLPFEDRDLKWCLLCHWSDHNTSNCAGGQGPEAKRESMCADLQWTQFRRGVATRWLWSEPKNIHELMDHLTTHQHHMLRIAEWFAERDNLLQAIMEDEEWMARLDPVVVEGETSADVYVAQIVAANNATKAFAVNSTGVVFLAFKQLVTGNRVRGVGETAVQFRARLASEVLQFPGNYPVRQEALLKLVASLEKLWTTYTTRMDELEANLLQKRYSGRDLSRAIQRIIRLPTSYFRIEEVRAVDNKSFWMPVFQPCGLNKLEEYKDGGVRMPGDELYKPTKIVKATISVARTDRVDKKCLS